MASSSSALPIEEQQLEEFAERASRLLVSVKWTPKNQADTRPEAGHVAWRGSSDPTPGAQDLSLVKIARTICRDPILLSEDVNHTLTLVRKGLCIGMHLSKTYTKFSGLDQLIALNARGGLSDAQKTEFRAKYQTASAIALFAGAYYITWELAGYKTEELGSLNLACDGIPELPLRDPVRAVECQLYYYAAHLEGTGQVQTSLDFVKMTQLYFKALVDELLLRADAFQFKEAFTNQSYKLEDSEFHIQGFEAEFDGSEVSIEFNRVELEEIVGNRDAKHDARRLASRLLCYDPVSQRNPLYDMGGLSPISMGYGEPGTGKSLLIAATATLLHDYCQQLGIPFLFWPMPDTVVSTFQGGSAERMMNWMRGIKDPSKIIYAPIDDAENNLEERTRQGVSAGVREVIGVFLRNTEGAYAVHRGNALIQLFTNLPDQIDKAVLSRINNRTYIGGAQSEADFIDQDYLWMRKHTDIDPKFIQMKDPKGFKYLEAQTRIKSMSEVYDAITEPSEERVRVIFDKVRAEHKPDGHAFYGELFHAIKEVFPFFTSRDIRNIQRAIDSRIMDFDLPGDWLEHPETFFTKDYDTKKAMLIELMRTNMKGLSFVDVRLQETVRYLDNLVNISESGRERRIDALTEDIDIRREAHKRAGDES